MLTMTQEHDIRKMYYEQGNSISEIARKTEYDRKTIRKYIDQDDWNVSPPDRTAKDEYPKLDPFKAEIDEWLEDDKHAKRKQRHTALRVFNRLTEEHGKQFDCSYRTVAGYVAMKKKEIFKSQDGFYRWSIPVERHNLILEMHSSLKMVIFAMENI